MSASCETGGGDAGAPAGLASGCGFGREGGRQERLDGHPGGVQRIRHVTVEMYIYIYIYIYAVLHGVHLGRFLAFLFFNILFCFVIIFIRK